MSLKDALEVARQDFELAKKKLALLEEALALEGEAPPAAKDDPESTLGADLERLGWQYNGQRMRSGSQTWYAENVDRSRLKGDQTILNATSPEQLLRRVENATVTKPELIPYKPEEESGVVASAGSGAVGIVRYGNTETMQPRRG